MFLGFGIDAWITIITMVVMLSILLFTRLRSDLVFLGAISILYVTGVLDVNEALSGFSSTTVAVIGVMFVLVAGLTYTGVLHWIVKRVLGWPKGYKTALLRLMIPVAVLSPFVNRTSLVTMFVGIVKVWSKRLNIKPSRLLIPVSFASCMGGICFIVATPPCLIISGYYASHSGHEMSVAAPLIPALCGLVTGMLTIILLHRLLPEREAPEAAFESTGDYTVELLVPSDNPHIGQSVESLGLKRVRGGSLIELRHFDNMSLTSPVPYDEPLLGGDRLIFAGQIEELLDMKLHLGLVNADHHMFSVSEEDIHRQLLTAYVNFNSSLIGTKLGDSDFEKKNNITLVAVSRRGKRIEQPPRQVVLQAGDTLLLACPPRLHVVTSELKRQLQFFDSTDVSGGIGWRTVLPATIMIAMVTLVMFDVLPLLAAGLIAAGAMLVFRCCTPSQAMDSINWSLLVTLAASIVLALAIQKTGIAESLAKGILDVSGSHPLTVMIAVCLAATIITEFFSNAATAAMIVPVMYSAAQQLGYDPYPFVIALMLTVCTGFLMPFSSSLYMMVYSAGGYRFSDFMRIGLPVKVVVFITYIVAVSIVYPFTPI